MWFLCLFSLFKASWSSAETALQAEHFAAMASALFIKNKSAKSREETKNEKARGGER
jgi:hypothetical protein